MRVLLVDEEVPFPLNTGKRLRTFNLFKHLAQKHQITFICRKHEGSDANDWAFKELGIEVLNVHDPILKKAGIKFYWALLTNLFSLYPYSVSTHYKSSQKKTRHKDLIMQYNQDGHNK